MSTSEKGRGKYGTVADVATHLSLSKAQVHNLIGLGHLEAIRLPGKGRRVTIRVSWQSVLELEKANATR